MVHVDAEVLAADAEGRCELDDGPAIAAEVARRLSCDASVVAIVEDGHGNPLDVGRKTRAIPPALRRALRSRDRGCRFPGCTSRRFVDGHHVRHWSRGGETSLANLVSLCRRHHRAVHEGGYAVEPTGDPTQPWGFLRRPDGTALSPAAPALPPTTHDAIKRCHAALGLDIGPATSVPGWYGERLDLGLAVDALLGSEEAAAG